MDTVTKPSLQDVVTALLMVAKDQRSYNQAGLELMALGLLPNTPPNRGARHIVAIASHLEQAGMYAKITPQTAVAMLEGETACSECRDPQMAEWLHERAEVWRGEAETLALNVVRRDRGELG